jgi:hypothetical protein
MLVNMHNSLITKALVTNPLTSKRSYFVVKDNLNNLNIPPFRGGILR